MMRNQNFEQQALAGCPDAQMHLAHFNYVTGNYSASIFYLYMVTNNANANDTYRAIAYNNLGHMYINQLGVALVAHITLEEAHRYFCSAFRATDGNIKLLIAQNVLALSGLPEELVAYAESALRGNSEDAEENFLTRGYVHVGSFASETEVDAFSSDDYVIRARATTRIYEPAIERSPVYDPETGEVIAISEITRSRWTGGFNFVYDVFRRIDSQFINFNHQREG